MLRECVNSFIAQTFANFELVIADDGSEEDISFVRDMDSRVKYVRQEHYGMAKAYNLALDNSSGEYIMPFGSDDLAFPNLIEEMLWAMEKFGKQYDVIYCNYLQQFQGGKYHRMVATHTLPQEKAYQEMLHQQYIPHCGSLWKKDKMPHYDESLTSGVDWESMLTAMENGVRFKRHKKKLLYYRVGHPREYNTNRQNESCDKILARRGYKFNFKTRKGEKICN